MDIPASPLPPTQPDPVVSPPVSPPPPPPAPIPQPKAFPWIAWSAALVVLVAILATAAIFIVPRISSPDELSIINQMVTGGSIRVASLNISSPKGGFLVIYRLLNPDLYGSVVATSFYLYPETYTDFIFPVAPDIDARTLAGNLFMGVLYEDTDESKNWEPQIDKEVKTIFGKQIKSLFRDLTPPDEPDAP